MSVSIPSTEPAQFIAGDTVKWTRSLSDYPATTWTLTYEFRGTVRKSVVCTASGSDFLATITAALSAAYPPGEYRVFARVSSGSESYTVWEGSITVKPDPSAGTSAQDRRTHARKMLDAIEAMMEGNASREEQGYEISMAGGTTRRLDLCPKADLIAFHSHYAQLVKKEQDAERIAQGGKSRNRILTVFTR